MKKLSRGLLISVEGIDGSGKTTLARNLVNMLAHDEFDSMLTREPGGTSLGVQLREILHSRECAVSNEAEFLLFASDRANHFSYVVLPALAKKTIVVSDRMADSSLVYQGYARGLDKTMIKTINAWAMQNREPDITFYVRITADQAKKRIEERNLPLTSFEKEKRSFFETLVKGFDDVFAQKKNSIILDGNLSRNEISNNAYEALTQWINKNNIITS